MLPSVLTTEVYVPNPFVVIPSILPVSSNDTSAFRGFVPSTLLTIRFPEFSPSNSPSMIFPPFELAVDLELHLALSQLTQGSQPAAQKARKTRMPPVRCDLDFP